VALGENPTTGGWRGAGTNGGTSLAIVRHSDGLIIPFWSQWWPVFAGLQLYAGIALPDSFDANGNNVNDEADSATYGTAIAVPYAMTPNQSIVTGYLNAIASVSEGAGCSRSGGGFSYPGGFAGCGCHAIMTVSSSAAGAQAIMAESWSALTSDNRNQSSSGYYSVQLSCNYNPSNSWSGGP
jgi:hypothetical protein